MRQQSGIFPQSLRDTLPEEKASGERNGCKQYDLPVAIDLSGISVLLQVSIASVEDQLKGEPSVIKFVPEGHRQTP